MVLKHRSPQPDDPSKTTNADSALQITPSPSQETPATGGALINSADSTTLSSPSASVIVNFHPSSSRREHGPVLFTNLPSATDASVLGFSQDAQAPVDAGSTSLAISTTTPSATAQPNAPPSEQSSGLSQNQTIAAILIPIIALLIIFVPIACIYTRRRRRLHRSTHLESDREMKPLSPTTTSGWLPMTSSVEHNIAQRHVPTDIRTPTQLQEPDVIPRRSPTMNSGYYSGLDQTATQYRPPTARPSVVDDPPPPYVPRMTPTDAAPELTSLHLSPRAPAIDGQLPLASLSEANLVAHAARVGADGPRSPFEDPEGDTVSEVSSLEENISRGTGMRREGGRPRDLDEMSVVSAPDLNADRMRSVRERGTEAHQIV